MKVIVSLENKNVIEINKGQAVNIGRAAGNDLVLNSPQVSRKHATITVNDQGVAIVDVGSTHGTFVNEKRIQNISLSNSALVKIGDQILKLEVIASGLQVSQPNQEMSLNKNDSSVLNSEINAGFGGALSLVMKTLPYVLFRFGIYALATFACVIWYLLVFTFLGLFAKNGSGGGALLAFFVLCLPLGIASFVFRSALYLLKAGHIAVLTELIHNRQVPHEGMVAYGKNVVTANLGQIGILFIVDGLIKGVVRVFNRTLDWVSNLLPIPGLNSVVGIVQTIIRMATTYIDECILSYNLVQKSKNVYESSCDGLILYAQNSKEILKSAAWAVVVDWLITAVMYVLMFVPVGIFVHLSPSLGTVGFIIAIMLALSFRAAFVRPLMLTYILMNFHRLRQGQQPDPEWQAKLHMASDKFRELEEKAKSFMPKPVTAATTGKTSA